MWQSERTPGLATDVGSAESREASCHGLEGLQAGRVIKWLPGYTGLASLAAELRISGPDSSGKGLAGGQHRHRRPIGRMPLRVERRPRGFAGW